MKRFLYKSFCVAIFMIAISNVYAQTHSSVHIDNKIYDIIEQAEMRGIIKPLSKVKPYSEKTVIEAINEIIVASYSAEQPILSTTEIKILYNSLEQFNRKKGLDWQRGGYYYESNGKIRATADVTFTADIFASGGIYNNQNNSQWGLSFTPVISVRGDLGKNISYDFNLFGNVSRAVLQNRGKYKIGEFWYKKENKDTGKREINSFANKAFFPFSFRKRWDGSVYKISNLSASGLEGWVDDAALGFGINSEINLSFLNDAIFIRFGRISREWASMDKGSSLIFNNTSHPFLALEAEITPFKWLTLSTLTGILEFPNNDYIVGNAYNSSEDYTKYDNAAFFQNAYSIAMIEVNFKYVHVDFGTTAVWPKRFELGYIYPLNDKVFYQNNVGDFDNIALFGNIKLTYPKIGSVWASLFLDEFNGLSRTTGLLGDFVHSTRNMYATQVGIKANFPFLPFSTISTRYTKVEPYCYTHHGINYTPWFTHYVSEAYISSGENLGYYLPPNSDELYFRFESSPTPYLTASAEYQFIRHGADFGSQAVNGSSIYSELPPSGRDDLRKYFLHDGAYEWFHIVKLGAQWSLKQFNIPITVYGNIGFVYSYFTIIDGTANDNKKYNYRVANTAEYPSEFGAIISGGVRIYF